VSVLLLTSFFVWMAIARPWGAYASWIVVMIGMTLFTLIVGRGVTGVWKGAFVDDRLRMSLSRLQLLMWTILVLSAFGTIAVIRMQHDAVSALDIAVPDTICALLGISATSLIGSPLIKKSQQETQTPSEQTVRTLASAQGQSADDVVVHGKVIKNKSIRQAGLVDIFMGEYVDDFALLDLAKIQMFFFTILLVIAYGTAVGYLLITDLLPSSLPDVGAGMLPLLGISHAGYLASKVVGAPPDTQQPPEGPAHGQ
jgi:hypothetical protein